MIGKYKEIVSELFILPFTAFQGVYETNKNQIFMIFSDSTPITNNHIKEITKIINKHGKKFTYEIYIHGADLETNIYNLCMLITIKEE